MFNNLYKYFTLSTDKPHILAYLNMWFYLNLRIFQNKLNSYILYHINILNNFKEKYIKIYSNFLNFEFFYFNTVKYLILFLIILIILI